MFATSSNICTLDNFSCCLVYNFIYEALHEQSASNTYSSKYMAYGKQNIPLTLGKHEGVKLVGVLNFETGAVYCEEHVKYDAEVFLGFLKNVLDSYSKGRIVIILDNARIHHAKLLQPYLDSMKERLKLVFLPPYSPNLNIIEGLWKWLKSEVINNVFFSNVCQIQQSVRGFIKYIKDIPSIVIDRLCVQM